MQEAAEAAAEAARAVGAQQAAALERASAEADEARAQVGGLMRVTDRGAGALGERGAVYVCLCLCALLLPSGAQQPPFPSCSMARWWHGWMLVGLAEKKVDLIRGECRLCRGEQHD